MITLADFLIVEMVICGLIAGIVWVVDRWQLEWSDRLVSGRDSELMLEMKKMKE